MAEYPDFDAADLADSILGADPPEVQHTAPPETSAPVALGGSAVRRGNHLGTVLALLLFAALSIAISLAVQLDDGSASEAEPPGCGGLYAQCCEEWNQDWGRGPCVEECDAVHDERDDRFNDRDGLFDAEEDLVEPQRRPSC